MNYFVIDFETANSKRDSVCALGIVEVLNNEIINEWDYLINPEDYFDSFNTFIHGITSDMVQDKPTFPQIWNEVKGLLDGKFIIAHNASFDISVLRWTLDKYGLEYPTFNYGCTRILSKKTWPSLVNYKLNTVADMLDIKFTHHQACEDSKAAAKVMDNIIKINDASSLEDLHQNLKVKIGQIFSNGYKPCEVKHTSSDSKPSKIVATTSEFDEAHEFYGKGIVFTGTLSMARKEAAQLAVDKGAIYQGGVVKATNYLVMGVQDYSKFADGQKSAKLKKAEDLIAKGQDLEIIGEDEFLRLL